MHRLTIALSLLCPALLPAQGSITAGQVSYTVGAISTTQAESVNSGFTGDPTSAADMMFEHWFYYRLDNDPDEFAFRNDGALTQTYSGSHADLDWANVDGRGQLRAELDLDVVSLASDSGFVLAQMKITNVSAAPVVLNFFTYVDIDVCTAANNSATGSPFAQRVTGTCANGDIIEISAIGADHWCSQAYVGASECGINDGSPTVLADAVLPFGPGDHTAAFQWRDRALGAGQSITFVSKLDHNPNPCTTQASASNYGNAAGGAGGAPTFVTTGLPEFGRTGSMLIGNVPPLASGALLFGLQRTNTPVGNVTLLVNSQGSVSLGADPTGTASFALALPRRAPNLCGVFVQFQYLYLDPTVVGPFPVGHTNAIEWRIGG